MCERIYITLKEEEKALFSRKGNKQTRFTKMATVFEYLSKKAEVSHKQNEEILLE